VTERVDASIRDVAIAFLHENSSVAGFTYAFRGAVQDVTQRRTLDGLEIELHDVPDAWWVAVWHDRPEIVDQLRVLPRAAAQESSHPTR
jgi:hypothetical protein